MLKAFNGTIYRIYLWGNGNEMEPATFCSRCLRRRPYEQWRICEDRQVENKVQRCNLLHSVDEEAYTKHMAMILDRPSCTMITMKRVFTYKT